MITTDFDESIFFLKRFLNGPAQVASVWPSSRFLSAEMFRNLVLDDGAVIVEYGPGTGAFTRHVQALVHAGSHIRYLGIEKDPGMFRYLRPRYPALDFVLGDALDIGRHMLDRNLPPATAILSGLPLILFSEGDLRAVIDAARARLRPGGIFRTFSYLHSYPSRGASDLRTVMTEFFDDFSISRPVLRNMPPAVTLTGRAPAPPSIFAPADGSDCLNSSIDTDRQEGRHRGCEIRY